MSIADLIRELQQRPHPVRRNRDGTLTLRPLRLVSWRPQSAIQRVLNGERLG